MSKILLFLSFASLASARPPHTGVLPRRGNPVFPWESPSLWVSPYRAALGEDFPSLSGLSRIVPASPDSNGVPGDKDVADKIPSNTNKESQKVGENVPNKPKVENTGVIGNGVSHLGLEVEGSSAPNPWDTQNKKVTSQKPKVNCTSLLFGDIKPRNSEYVGCGDNKITLVQNSTEKTNNKTENNHNAHELNKVESSGIAGGSLGMNLGLESESFGAPNPWDTQNKKTSPNDSKSKENQTETESVSLNEAAPEGYSSDPQNTKILHEVVKQENITIPEKAKISPPETVQKRPVQGVLEGIAGSNVANLVLVSESLTPVLQDSISNQNTINEDNKGNTTLESHTPESPQTVTTSSDTVKGSVQNRPTIEKEGVSFSQNMQKPDNIEKGDSKKKLPDKSKVESSGIVGGTLEGLGLGSEGFVPPNPWDTQSKKTTLSSSSKIENVSKVNESTSSNSEDSKDKVISQRPTGNEHVDNLMGPVTDMSKVESSGLGTSSGVNLGLEGEGFGAPNPWDSQNRKETTNNKKEVQKGSESSKVESTGFIESIGGPLGLLSEGTGSPNPWDTQNKKNVSKIQPVSSTDLNNGTFLQLGSEEHAKPGVVIPEKSKVESSGVFGNGNTNEGLGLGLESEGFFPPNPWDTQSKKKLPEETKIKVPDNSKVESSGVVGGGVSHLGIAGEGFGAPNPWDVQNKKEAPNQQESEKRKNDKEKETVEVKTYSFGPGVSNDSPLEWAKSHQINQAPVLADIIGLGAAGSGMGSLAASTVGSGAAFAVASLPQRRRPAVPERLVSAPSSQLPEEESPTTESSTSTTPPPAAVNSSKAQKEEDEENCECGWNAECIGGHCTCLPGHAGDPRHGCEPATCTDSDDCPEYFACNNNGVCSDPCEDACGPKAVCRVRRHVPRCSCPAPLRGDPRIGCNQPQTLTSEEENTENPSLTPDLEASALACNEEDCRRPTKRPPRPPRPPRPEEQKEPPRPGFSSATSGANAAPAVSSQGSALSEAPGRGQSNANSNSAAFVYGQLQGSVSLSSASSSG